MNQATLEFISKNADADVRQLALRGNSDVDMPFALDQIAGRQTARLKLPSWSAIDGLLYPPRISMEQCSSELTARYKAEVVGTGNRIVDLTGGFGVDISFLARRFSKSVYVERQEALCDIARHNFALLRLTTEVVCADSTDYLKQMDTADVVFIDPARRDTAGQRIYAIADCTPNIITLRDHLMSKAQRVLIKLSPMLDWRKAVSDIGKQWVSQVHIVAVNNECKELLIMCDKQKGGESESVVCVNLMNDGSRQEFKVLQPTLTTLTTLRTLTTLESLKPFLFEPNAAIMKAGCYAELAEAYGLEAVAANSHLFVGNTMIQDFPGRRFVVDCITTMNKQELRTKLKGLSQANITVRNFPMTVAQLRHRLKIKEGGSNYLFATTQSDGQHVLIVAHKA